MLRSEYAARAPIRRALQLLRNTYNIRDLDVVELGSGLGHNLDIFAGDNRVIGIEALTDAADAANTRGIQTVVADLAAPVPLESAGFDLVLCLDVLEHLTSPRYCLIEAHRLLRTNGLLVVNVPNHFSLAGRINIARGLGIDSVKFFPNHADWENPHLRFFRHSSLTDLINRCHFRIDADWSRQFPSVPILNKLLIARNSPVVRALAARCPELFAGGFFVICRRRETVHGE
jgi:SAM-dependent methyltransferase